MNYTKLKAILMEKYGTITKASKALKIPYWRLKISLLSPKGLRMSDVEIIAKALSVENSEFSSFFLQKKFKN